MATLETFPNSHPPGLHHCPHLSEFTAVCPKTGQPDFGTIRVFYVPDRLVRGAEEPESCIFSPSRNAASSYENVVNVILDDLVTALKPRQNHESRGSFNVRRWHFEPGPSALPGSNRSRKRAR